MHAQCARLRNAQHRACRAHPAEAGYALRARKQMACMHRRDIVRPPLHACVRQGSRAGSAHRGMHRQATRQHVPMVMMNDRHAGLHCAFMELRISRQPSAPLRHMPVHGMHVGASFAFGGAVAGTSRMVPRKCNTHRCAAKSVSAAASSAWCAASPRVWRSQWAAQHLCAAAGHLLWSANMTQVVYSTPWLSASR